MKILYDISALGIGYANTGRRTGIYRVVENLALELAALPESGIHFCSFYSMDALHQSIAYQQSVPAFRNVPFPRLETDFFKKKKLRHRMSELAGTLQSGIHISPSVKLLTHLKILQARLIQKAYSDADKRLLPVAELKKTDIYHSPFFPLTDEIKNSGVKKLFVTCYDLIPILKPDYCTQEQTDRMLQFLNSITADTWVLCISAFTRSELLHYMGNRVDPQKVVVTELAASASFYKSNDLQINRAVRARYAIPEGPFILSVCTFEQRKNIETVLQAFRQLVQQQHLQQLSLVLVGNKGSQSEALLALHGNPVITNRIIMTGFVADADLASLYSEAMVFVYPSLYEGFGLPPLEAMQCGTPVITSNTTSLPEVAGDAGILINPADATALSQAIWSVYSQPALQQQLSQKSLQRAALFSWKRCAQETLAAYKTALA